jgi:hypothetical protein
VLSQFIGTGGWLGARGGRCRHRLRKTGAARKVHGITLTLTWQTNNRDLLRPVGAAAKCGFRRIVTGWSGNVTGWSGSVTGWSGIMTVGSLEGFVGCV